MDTIQGINGELRPGDWVIATPPNPHGYLVGQITKISPLGTTEHGVGSLDAAAHVDFTAFDYPSWRHTEIADHFNEAFRYEVDLQFHELPLNDVIMAPGDLIRVTEFGIDEIRRLIESHDGAKSFCGCFISPLKGNLKFDELTERVTKNLSDYHNDLEGFEKWALIDMAEKIFSMSEAHYYMTGCHNFSDAELDFYLQFQNPLEVVADAWQERNENVLDEMGFAMDQISERKESFLKKYPLTSDIRVVAADKFAEGRKTSELPEQAATQKPSLASKLQAAGKKVEAQEARSDKTTLKNGKKGKDQWQK